MFGDEARCTELISDALWECVAVTFLSKPVQLRDERWTKQKQKEAPEFKAKLNK